MITLVEWKTSNSIIPKYHGLRTAPLSDIRWWLTVLSRGWSHFQGWWISKIFWKVALNRKLTASFCRRRLYYQFFPHHQCLYVLSVQGSFGLIHQWLNICWPENSSSEKKDFLVLMERNTNPKIGAFREVLETIFQNPISNPLLKVLEKEKGQSGFHEGNSKINVVFWGLHPFLKCLSHKLSPLNLKHVSTGETRPVHT